MSLLDASLAQKFIDKTARDLDFNINIMNEKGIIIASKDASRLGDFHEVAHGIITGVLDTGIVNEERRFMNTKPGVNLCINYKDSIVGVICVTGDPNYVAPFATFVKNSIETMLEYELQREGKRKQKNRLDQFMYYLLFEENVDMALANSMADELDLNKTVPRIAIIIKCQKKYDTQAVLKALAAAENHSYLDIATLSRNDNVVLFKALPDMKMEELVEYKHYITDFIESFLDKLPDTENRQNFAIYVGAIQTRIERYRAAYNQVQEISIQIKDQTGIHFFNDHVLDYFRHLVNMNVYDDIFNLYNSIFSEDDRQMVAETVEVLSRNNYNVVSSAKDLFIHRNTLVFRLNKIKNTLGIDPITNASEREFLNELAYYFRHK